MAGDQLVGSCSNCVISEGRWRGPQNWSQAVGGPFIEGFDPKGDTLYGMDIGVHPEFRKRGVGRAFYAKRFDFVKSNGLARYGTACRIPDYARYKEIAVESFVKGVVSGSFSDRTLSPLLRYGLRCLGVKKDYLEDEESSHNAALLLWLPEFEHDKEGDD